MKKSDTKPGDFLDHPRKRVFRTLWGRPILELLNKITKNKLIYLGLPGFQALDVLEWIEYLEKIIAFEWKENNEENDDSIELLINIFNDLEQKGKIDSFSLYKGILEKIVLQGLDENGQTFKQKDFITVYNLDFCNSLTSPYKVSDTKGNVYKYYKLDAINRLLEFQENTINEQNKFILFLTVNSKFWEQEVFSIKNIGYIKIYNNKLKALSGEPKNIRLLKAYTFHHLKTKYNARNFCVEFLPPIFYKGSGGIKDSKGKLQEHWLMTFTVLGTKIPADKKSVTLFNQNEKEFLEDKFLFANDKDISCFTEKKFTENDVVPDPVTLLSDSFTLKELWK